MINAFYPYKKILEDEMDLLVWRKAFSEYDKDITLKATEQLCNEDATGLLVNIASIKKRVAELEEEKKRKEYFIQQQKEVEENLNYQASDYTKNKLKEMLAKYGR